MTKLYSLNIIGLNVLSQQLIPNVNKHFHFQSSQPLKSLSVLLGSSGLALLAHSGLSVSCSVHHDNKDLVSNQFDMFSLLFVRFPDHNPER